MLASSIEGTVQTAIPGRVLARFLELRGRRIIRACGALWYTVPGGFLMSLPYQSVLDPDPEELSAMIREAKVFGARFPSIRWKGLESGIYVRRGNGYDLRSVHLKHRPRVRRGLQRFEIRLAEKSELLEQGCELNLSTMRRQGRYDPEFGSPRLWRRFVESAFACPEVQFPAAFAGRRIAAYMITCREDQWLHILHQMSRHEDLPNFPNHVLTYTVTAQSLSDPSIEAVSYGYVPLFSAGGLHEYKLRFGYELVPHRSAIQLHPALAAVLNALPARAGIRLARRLRPNWQQLETFETVLEGAQLSGRL
jgi:hypothetical protein